MFGKNRLEGTTWNKSKVSEGQRQGQALLVNNIWHTIQGEGPFAGMPAIFIRLTGCNLACWFCDTDFEDGTEMHLDAILLKMMTVSGTIQRHPKLVVITGGEPMRQQISPLCHRLLREGYKVQIETAGTVWPPGLEKLFPDRDLTIVCSPKTHVVHARIERHCHDFKYIVQTDDESAIDGLPYWSTQNKGYRDLAAAPYRPPKDVDARIWVQPMDEYFDPSKTAMTDPDKYAANLRACKEIAMKHGYRVSLQLHKLIGVE